MCDACRLLGITVRESRVPGAGNGLFAARTFRRGEGIAPYTGHRYIDGVDAMLRCTGNRTASPYAIGLHNGTVIEAAVRRGVAAYANEPAPGATNNATFLHATITPEVRAVVRPRRRENRACKKCSVSLGQQPDDVARRLLQQQVTTPVDRTSGCRPSDLTIGFAVKATSGCPSPLRTTACRGCAVAAPRPSPALVIRLLSSSTRG